MIVTITGTRTVRDEYAARGAIRNALNQFDPDITTIVHGMAPGIDQLAESEAIRWGVKGIARFPAEWAYWRHMGAVMRDEGMKKSAGKARNNEMVETLPPDILLAFPGPQSIGTWHMVNLCRALGVPIRIHHIDSPSRR